MARTQVVVTDDANTSSLTPKTNYGGSIALIVCSGSNTYIKFNLANLGSGVTGTNISKATLVLYVDAVLKASLKFVPNIVVGASGMYWPSLTNRAWRGGTIRYAPTI